MKLSEIVTAAPALQKLILQDLPLLSAWKLSQLIGLCNPALDFFGVERLKCRDQNDMDKLLDMEIEIEAFDPVVIPLGENVRISASDVKSLETFVQWEVP